MRKVQLLLRACLKHLVSLLENVQMFHVYSTPAQKHWLFAEEIQKWLCDECIPFNIWGLPVSSPHIRIEGLTATMVPVARWKIDPRPNEVVVSVVQKGKASQISIDLSYLVPQAPSEGNKVLIIRFCWIGQVGKLVELKHGCCTVELEPSGAVSYFKDEDVVNVLKLKL